MTTQYFYLSAVDGSQKCLIDKEIITGRDPQCTLVLKERQASRRHAKLSPGEGGILIEDLNSTNGTVVNGEKITTSIVMKPGEHMSIGELLFVVEAASPGTEGLDPDATMLISPSEELSKLQNQAAGGDRPQRQESGSVATAEKPKTAPAPQQTSPVRHEATERRPASQPPPSWVMSNQQAVDGTKFLSKEMLNDVMQQSAEAIIDEVNEPTLIGSCNAILNRRFPLSGEIEQWEIGRAENCDVILNHDSVSSNHAQIISEGGRWKLVDLMSANGTYINTKKSLSGYLSSGDVVRFGHMECTFVLPDGYGSDGGGNRSGFIRTAAIAFVVTAIIAAAGIYAFQTWF